MFSSSHNQNISAERDAPRSSNRHGKIDSQRRMRLQKDVKSMTSGSFYYSDVTVMNIRLDVVLMKVVFRDGKSLHPIFVSKKTDLTRRGLSGKV